MSKNSKITKETQWFFDQEPNGKFIPIIWNGVGTEPVRLIYDIDLIYKALKKVDQQKSFSSIPQATIYVSPLEALQCYLLAPKHIEAVTTTAVRDENNKVWSIGLTPMLVTIDVEKIGAPAYTQHRLNSMICEVAREFTLLPHIKYKHNIEDQYAITGRLPEKYFDRLGDYSFKIKADVLPSDAIKSIFAPQDQPLIIECSSAMQIIYYMSVYKFCVEILKATANKVFNEFLFKGMKIEAILSLENPVSNIQHVSNVDFKTVIQSPEQILNKTLPGSMRYITNVEPYGDRHLTCSSRGLNVIYLGQNKQQQHEFAGLFTEKRVRTYDEIVKSLIDDYNAAPEKSLDKMAELSKKKTHLPSDHTSRTPADIIKAGQDGNERKGVSR